MNRQAFINNLMPAAIEASNKTGIDPRIIVAQAAQETGWGRFAPGNNYFGIKSHGKGGGQTFATHEVVNGKRIKINDSFRQFSSPEESVAGYADFMSTNPRYTRLRQAQGLDAQLHKLGRSGYATDPNYKNSVGAIARSIKWDGAGQELVSAGSRPDGTPVTLAGGSAFDPVSLGAVPLNSDEIVPSPPKTTFEELKFNPQRRGAVPFNPQELGAIPVGDGSPLSELSNLTQNPKFDQPAATRVPGMNDQEVLSTDPSGAFVDGVINGVPIIGPSLTSGINKFASGVRAGLSSEVDYAQALDDLKTKKANRQAGSPFATGLGELTGAVGSLAAGGGTALGAKILGNAGRNLLTRSVASAGSGAAITGADVLARGGSTEDAANGALISGAIGGALPGVAKGLGYLGGVVNRNLLAPIMGNVNVNGRASKVISEAMRKDIASGQKMLTAEDEAYAKSQGMPVFNADRGGESVRTLTRKVANEDPAAWGRVSEATQQRYYGQTQRGSDFITHLVGGQIDSVSAKETLKEAARAANKPAYEAAEKSAAAQSMWSPELQDMTRYPWVQKAMKEAEQRSSNKLDAAPIANPFNFKDGKVTLKTLPDGTTATPNLRYWDQVQRNLREQIEKAYGSNATSKAADLVALRNKLLEHLDTAVPKFKEARVGAAEFFDAEDALEAGQKFILSSKGMPESRAAIAKMTPPEKELFAIGAASNLREKVRAINDNRNVVIDNMFNSLQGRERIVLALGRQRASQLEAAMRSESAFDALRSALGNSQTARQLSALGIVGGSAGYYQSGGDLKSALIAAVALPAIKYRGDKLVMGRIADMLLSEDPKAMEKAVKLATRTPSGATALRAIEKAAHMIAISGTSAAMSPAQQQ